MARTSTSLIEQLFSWAKMLLQVRKKPLAVDYWIDLCQTIE